MRLARATQRLCTYLIACTVVWSWSACKSGTAIESFAMQLRNTCFFDGKAYTIGAVVEASPGIMCRCAAASDAAAKWSDAQLI